MKKLIPIALIAALSGVQLVSVAHPVDRVDHQASPVTSPSDMKSMHETLHLNMAATKTDAERQQLMAEHQQSMQGMRAQMHAQMHAQMGAHDHGNMKGMPGMNADMQKRMSSMREQMVK